MHKSPIFDLRGRVALVTGASSGIGAHWSQILAMAGAKVVLAARRADRLEALKSSILASGGNAIAVSMDVSDEASTVAAFDEAERHFGVVDTIVANAGVNSEGSATDLPVDEFDTVMDVNIRGVFLTVREGARRLIADGSKSKEHGRIVINASITANHVSPGLAAYSASKAAVQQLGKVLARDWARLGVNVNIICPGYIRTELSGGWFDSEGGLKQIHSWPRRRLMAEADLDVPLLYLCSDSSRGVTGSSFTIDDGQSL